MTMDENTITVLAREYAEEIYPNLSDKIISLRTQEIKNAERLIRFLLRRYCLVEKSKVEKGYKKACESVNKHSATTGCLFFVGQKQTIENLFPEIAK